MTKEEDDKPTVVLDLEALKKEALKKDEELESAEGIEFAVGAEDSSDDALLEALADEDDDGLSLDEGPSVPVVLFDFQTDLFTKSKTKLPKQHDYILVTDLKGLNKQLANKDFKIIMFHYNANPKAVNKLTAQIKVKFPTAKTIIVAKNLSDAKAQAHKKTKSGANGYITLPFETEKVNQELLKIYNENH
jgi:CheY-like chemotaxis protein